MQPFIQEVYTVRLPALLHPSRTGSNVHTLKFQNKRAYKLEMDNVGEHRGKVGGERLRLNLMKVQYMHTENPRIAKKENNSNKSMIINIRHKWSRKMWTNSIDSKVQKSTLHLQSIYFPTRMFTVKWEEITSSTNKTKTSGWPHA